MKRINITVDQETLDRLDAMPGTRSANIRQMVSMWEELTRQRDRYREIAFDLGRVVSNHVGKQR